MSPEAKQRSLPVEFLSLERWKRKLRCGAAQRKRAKNSIVQQQARSPLIEGQSIRAQCRAESFPGVGHQMKRVEIQSRNCNGAGDSAEGHAAELRRPGHVR